MIKTCTASWGNCSDRAWRNITSGISDLYEKIYRFVLRHWNWPNWRHAPPRCHGETAICRKCHTQAGGGTLHVCKSVMCTLKSMQYMYLWTYHKCHTQAGSATLHVCMACPKKCNICVCILLQYFSLLCSLGPHLLKDRSQLCKVISWHFSWLLLVSNTSR